MILRNKEFKSSGSIVHFPSSLSMPMTNSENPHLMLASNIVPVIGVHFSRSKLKLKVGQTEDLYITILPDQALAPQLKWAITNEDIVEATFHHDHIHVKAKNAGKTIVIVTTNDGQFRDLCIITVTSYLTTNK